MQVLQGDFQKEGLMVGPSVMTLGNFDGVHQGHQFLIDHVRAGADQLGVPALVLTFSPHPSHIVHGAKPVPLLFSQEDQNQEIAKRGVDYLVVQKFDEAFSSLEPEDFLRQYLFPKFKPRKVVLGHDFVFGKGQKGDFSLFTTVAQEFDCEVKKVPAFDVDGAVVSSSKIRQALLEGEVARVQEWLQRPFYIQSIIEKGQQLGRKLGFPTANLKGEFTLLPKDGVYFGRAHVLEQVHWSVMNIGVRPTIDSTEKLTVECHLLDFIGDIYGHDLKFEFIERIRGEQKFPNLEELKMQIDRDIVFARTWVGENGRNY